jgi:DNA-binding response OmpR family regulator
MTAPQVPIRQTILIVDDEQTLRETLKYNLSREGYRVLTAADGMEALRLVDAEAPDLMVLDIMMPGLSGFDVCRVVRKTSTIPVLMLSAREDEIDKVLALEIGADDYMTKPFGLRELLARVRAMLRRAGYLDGVTGTAPQESPYSAQTAVPSLSDPRATAPPLAVTHMPTPTGTDVERGTRLVIGDLVVDTAARTALMSGREISLKAKEFDLLAFLASNPGRVFSREALLQRVWGYDFVGTKRTVDSHISSLRRKLEKDPGNPQIIQTLFGVGYKLNRPVPEKAEAN